MDSAAFWTLCKQAYDDWTRIRGSRLAAALAFYAIFSLAPLLILAITIASLIYGEAAAKGLIATQIQRYVGRAGAEVIQGILQNSATHTSGFAATVGVVTLLAGAIGIFTQLQDALNTIWGVVPDPVQGFWNIVKGRIAAFIAVVGVGVAFMAMLMTSIVLSAAGSVAGRALPEFSYASHLIEIAVSFFVVLLLFAYVFKSLPEATVQWRDVWAGAAATAALFIAGKSLIGIYLGRSTVSSAYGAAGSLVALLLWIYYSAQIFLLGAEFTKCYAMGRGSHPVPKEHASSVTPASRAEQGMPKQ